MTSTPSEHGTSASPSSATFDAPTAPSTDSGAPVSVVILAAGMGTRMKSATPKMLHELGGRTMLAHALHAAAGATSPGTDPAAGPAEIVVVVGHERKRVTAAVAEEAERLGRTIKTAVQEEQNGTGHAVQCGLAALDGFQGTVVVTNSDCPLLDGATLRDVLSMHEQHPRAGVTLLTATQDDPTGYGRVVRNVNGEVTEIVEQADATDEQLEITEINSGVYAFDSETLRTALTSLTTDNEQGELYLTDVIKLARMQDRIVRAHRIDDVLRVAGVNDRVQLAQLSAEHNRRILERWMRAGVTVIDPTSTFIDTDVELARDVVLHPGTQLRGATTVGEGAEIGPDTTLQDVSVGAGARIIRTHGLHAEVGPQTTVGPFSYLRPGTVTGTGAKIGTFVETKNASIGAGTKIPHLTYVGDATIGEHSNIGASSVFVNYDGVNKHHTTIGSHVRTGSDTMFIAPVTVGDGAYSGAGTIIRDDVPPGALAVSGGKQRNIDRWVVEKRSNTASAEAARQALAKDDDDER